MVSTRTVVVAGRFLIAAAGVVLPVGAWGQAPAGGGAGGQASVPAVAMQPGVTFRVYQVEGDIKNIPVMAENQTPNFDEVRPTIDFQAADFPKLGAPIVAQVKATLRVDVAGEYVFRLTSDDGSRAKVGGKVVVNHDGRHGVTAKAGEAVKLEKGSLPLVVDYFDSGGGRRLLLEWRTPGQSGFVKVPAEQLSTEIDNARVVAPGIKALRDERRPGDGKPVTGVHPAYTVTHIAPDPGTTGFVPMIGAMTMMNDGRLIVGTFDPLQRTDTDLPDIESKKPDRLYAVTGAEGDPEKMTVRVVADGLYEPLGLVAVGDVLYVSHRRAIERLRDTDGDGYFETREVVGTGWEAWNYHQFCFGLLHRDGKLYATLSTAMAPPGWKGMNSNAAPNGVLRGSVIEVDLATNTVSAIAGGVRSPNGIGFGPEGSIFYCDNQGTWMPTNQMGEVVLGRFFGHYNNTNVVPQLEARFPTGGIASIWCDRLRSPAALDLVHNDFCNSPSEPTLITSGPYAGQMLIGELTAGGLRRANMERVNGQWQGAAFQFTQGLSVGVNRVAWGKNGTLFIGGIGAGGNWNWKGTRAGLDRLTPNGKTCFEMKAIYAKTDGFEVEFTGAVDPSWLGNAANYTLRQWRYAPSVAYGGPKVDEEPLKVWEAVASADGMRVVLKVDGLKAGRTVSVRIDPVSKAGEKIWATEGFYTLNEIPRADVVREVKVAGKTVPVDGLGVGVLPPAEGVVLIGRSAEANFTTPATEKNRPAGKRMQAEMLSGPEYVEVGKGDLTSRAWFGDAHVHVEWYCPPGGEGQRAGNSGVYLQSLYELQVLGTLPGEGRPNANEAAAIYNVKAADKNASTGPGTWQAYDLWFTAARFERFKKVRNARLTAYWNGVLVHDDVEISGPTGGAAAGGENGPMADVLERAEKRAGGEAMRIGPLRLQDHGTDAQGPVRYRNVWVAPIGNGQSAKSGVWETLSEGASLDERWVVRGGKATFASEAATDGKGREIVGRSAAGTPNTFLVSKKVYRDFELVFEARQDAELNSGVQIRSHVEGGIDNRGGKLIGCQVELDPSERAYSGGLYDEGRRGWISPLIDNPAARSAYRKDDWNTVRVVARGPVVRTWINGAPAAEMFDATDSAGHIALQVHDVGSKAEPLAVKFRNVRVRELGAAEGR